MFKSVATWFLLASSAAYAAPAEVDIERRVVAKGIADFERLNTSSVGVLGYYGGLKYTGIAAVPAGTGKTISGLAPKSGTNVGAYGKVLGGTASPIITSEFDGTKTANFTLSSFYFGCVDGSNKPVSCKVSVSGYNKGGDLLIYMPFYFTASGGLLNNLAPALLKSFANLSYVRRHCLLDPNARHPPGHRHAAHHLSTDHALNQRPAYHPSHHPAYDSPQQSSHHPAYESSQQSSHHPAYESSQQSSHHPAYESSQQSSHHPAYDSSHHSAHHPSYLSPYQLANELANRQASDRSIIEITHAVTYSERTGVVL